MKTKPNKPTEKELLEFWTKHHPPPETDADKIKRLEKELSASRAENQRLMMALARKQQPQWTPPPNYWKSIPQDPPDCPPGFPKITCEKPTQFFGHR